MERVFVTGGTGFVGRAIIRALVGHGFNVRCLVREGSEPALGGLEAIERVSGDVLEPEWFVPFVKGCSAVIHLVGIIRERPSRRVTFERLHTEASANMLSVAREAGVTRYVHMSALGARASGRSAYHRTKWRAEEAVRQSGLDWTIFRPSVIFGPGDGFMTRLVHMVRRLPAVPVLGDGRYRLQPVCVEHVAEGFARSLLSGTPVGRTYDIAGPEPYPFDDILDLIGLILGKPVVRKLHAPMELVKVMTRGLQWLPAYPVTMDQIHMLEEESVVDSSPFYRDFALAPESLQDGIRRLVASG
jgi:NADH dehydrogenase